MSIGFSFSSGDIITCLEQNCHQFLCDCCCKNEIPTYPCDCCIGNTAAQQMTIAISGVASYDACTDCQTYWNGEFTVPARLPDFWGIICNYHKEGYRNICGNDFWVYQDVVWSCHDAPPYELQVGVGMADTLSSYRQDVVWVYQFDEKPNCSAISGLDLGTPIDDCHLAPCLRFCDFTNAHVVVTAG